MLTMVKRALALTRISLSRRLTSSITAANGTCHLLRSRLSHSAVSSLYRARLLRNLASSCCNSVWRSRETLALTMVVASATTSTNHASDSPAAPIIQVIASATPRYRAVRIASASLCKEIFHPVRSCACICMHQINTKSHRISYTLASRVPFNPVVIEPHNALRVLH